MRIALVSIHPYPSPQAIPLANAFLQASLTLDPPLAGVETVCADFFLDTPLQTCLLELASLQPDAVGFSLYVWNRTNCCNIASSLKQQNSRLKIFAGGPEATADHLGVLGEAPFDWVIAGEGELPFREVCRALEADQEPLPSAGIVTRASTELTPARVLTDLDLLPSPWLTGILDSAKYRGVLWQLSRGCGFACDFCFDSRGVSGVRRFSLERVEAELRLFGSTGVSQIFVLDSTFNQDMPRAKRILRMIREIAPHIHFHFEVRSEFIDREMAQLFSEVVCSLQIGLQSADPAVLKNVGRHFDRKKFSTTVGLLNQTGAVFGFDLMYGLPGESLAGFRASIDYAIGLYPNHLDIFPLAILPGTVLAQRSAALRLQHLTTPPYTLVSSPDFSPEEMETAGRLALACSIFYTRGKAVAWFNSLVTALKLSPSGLLERFLLWMEHTGRFCLSEADLDDAQVWLLQREFLHELLRKEKSSFLIPLVLDLVDYHYHYAVAAQHPPLEIPGEEQLQSLRLLEISCHRSPSLQLAVFSHEILDILEAGEPVLRQFVRHHHQTGSFAAIYSRPDGIATESLIEPYFRLLENMDGVTPCGRLASSLGIALDEAESFLEFAVAEGLLIPAAKSPPH